MPNLLKITKEMTTKEIIKECNTSLRKLKITECETPYHYFDTKLCYELNIIYHKYNITNTYFNKKLNTIDKINKLRNEINNNDSYLLLENGSRCLKSLNECDDEIYDIDYPDLIYEIFDYLGWIEFNTLRKKYNNKRTKNKRVILNRICELIEIGYDIDDDYDEYIDYKKILNGEIENEKILNDEIENE